MKLAIRDRVEPEVSEAEEAGVFNRASELTDRDADRLKD
jgi:hypothetical protein